MEPEAYVEMYHAEADHWWYRGMRLITERLLTMAFPQRRDLRILDAGCGTGGNLSFLNAFGSIYGIDYSTLALSFARKTHVGVVAQATVETLPIADCTFDVVTSFDVLYCQEVIDDVHALSEFARVLRPQGIVLIRLPALDALRGPHDAKVHGVRRYTLAELRSKLSLVGLESLHFTYANSLLLPIAWLSRWSQQIRLKRGQSPDSDLKPLPPFANNLLRGILSLEAAWIGSGYGFPLGVSVFGLARKPV